MVISKYLTYLLIFFSTICSNGLIGQEDVTPPESLLFKNVQPEWVNFPIDSFYYPTMDSLRTAYNSRAVRAVKEFGEDIYILEMTNDLPPGIDPDGYILRKIDKQTGEQLWASINTLYSGNLHHESYHWQSILSIDENIINLQGLRQVPYIDNDFPLWYLSPVNANPIVNIISTKSGELVNQYVSSDTTEMDLKRNYTFAAQSTFNVDSTYFYIYGGPNRKEDGVLVLELDQNFDFVDTSVYSQIKIEGPTEYLSGNVKPYRLTPLGDNLFAITYIYVKDWGNIIGDDHLVQIAIVDLSDPSTPDVLSRTNLNEYLLYDYHLNGFRPEEINGQFLIQKTTYDGQIDQSWMIWIDRLGEVVTYIPKLSTEDYYYEHGFFPLYADKKKMIGYAPRNNFEHIDILSIEEGDSTVLILHTLELENEAFALVPFAGKIVDNFLVLGGWLNTVEGDPSEQLYEIMRGRFGFNLAFDLDKLGIDLSVSTEEPEYLAEGPILFPNPSDGIFHIRNFDAYKFAYCKITNAQGQLVALLKREEIRNENIDISHLDSGNYFINFYDERDVQLYNVVRCSKI
jgi:hypothetical protein